MTIEFWHEFASSYSYLSALRIEGMARERGIEVRWQPFLLGPIFAAQGWTTSPFVVQAEKGRYMWRDVARRAARLGLPFQRPSIFPQNSLLAARVMLIGLDQGWGPDFARAIYRAEFERGEPIGEATVIARLIEHCGADAQSTLRLAAGEEIKLRLRRQVDRAKELGIFGAPSFVVAGELFWGDDRLEEALEWAGRPGR